MQPYRFSSVMVRHWRTLKLLQTHYLRPRSYITPSCGCDNMLLQYTQARAGNISPFTTICMYLYMYPYSILRRGGENEVAAK